MKFHSKLMIALRSYGARRIVRTAFHALRGGCARPLWRDNPHYQSVFGAIREHTLIDEERSYVLYQFARHAALLPGQFSEIGVYRGGSARLLAELRGTKTLYLFDTFAGMPPAGKSDFVQEGDFFDTSLESVRKFVGISDSIRYLPGYFPATAHPVREERFALVHVDVDRAQSASDCCSFFLPRLVPGGLLIFDDYGHAACAALTAAVDQFFEDKRESPIYLPTGQAVVIKT